MQCGGDDDLLAFVLRTHVLEMAELEKNRARGEEGFRVKQSSQRVTMHHGRMHTPL
jgi:hypothetical protein